MIIAGLGWLSMQKHAPPSAERRRLQARDLERLYESRRVVLRHHLHTRPSQAVLLDVPERGPSSRDRGSLRAPAGQADRTPTAPLPACRPARRRRRDGLMRARRKTRRAEAAAWLALKKNSSPSVPLSQSVPLRPSRKVVRLTRLDQRGGPVMPARTNRSWAGSY